MSRVPFVPPSHLLYAAKGTSGRLDTGRRPPKMPGLKAHLAAEEEPSAWSPDLTGTSQGPGQDRGVRHLGVTEPGPPRGRHGSSRPPPAAVGPPLTAISPL